MVTAIERSPARHGVRSGTILLALGIGLLACVLGSLAIGRYPLPPATAAAILLSKLFPLHAAWTADMEVVVMKIRLPRILAALEVGAALAAAGAAYQGMFRNPLVSPDILGVTAGAGLGASLAILFAVNGVGLQAMAFAGGLLAVGATCLIGLWRSQVAAGGLALILTGVIIERVFTALISLVKFVADPTNSLPAITFWLMGGLGAVTACDVACAALPIGVGVAGLLLSAWRLNVLCFGDEEAYALGIEVGRMRLLVVACATLATASAVAVGGVIGLVGLVVPYLGRLLVGPDHRLLLPACILLGPLYLLLVDDLARSLLPAETPLGILTALLGAPLFVFLLARSRGAWA
jgi:iron complex transport system permease protein